MDTVWEQSLHQNSTVIFNLALQRLDRVVVTVPYQIHHLSYTEQLLASSGFKAEDLEKTPAHPQ